MYGSPTRDGEFGWQASLELLHPSLGFIGHWCGGVLVNKYWVVSSAHCVHKWVRLKRKWEMKRNEICGHEIKLPGLIKRKGVKVNAGVWIEVIGVHKIGNGIYVLSIMLSISFTKILITIFDILIWMSTLKFNLWSKMFNFWTLSSIFECKVQFLNLIFSFWNLSSIFEL